MNKTNTVHCPPESTFVSHFYKNICYVLSNMLRLSKVNCESSSACVAACVPNQSLMRFSFGSDGAHVGGRQRSSSLGFRIALKRRC